MALLASALLLLAALVLVAGQLLEHRRRDRRVADRLQGRMGGDARLGTLMRQLGGSTLAQRSVSLDSETLTLLNRVGWRTASQRSCLRRFLMASIALPRRRRSSTQLARISPWRLLLRDRKSVV